MDTKTFVHTLVVSDLHIGGSCRARQMADLLDSVYCDRLIINGDLFERGRPFSREEIRLINRLCYNSNKLVCVRGNHDPSHKDSVWRFIGVRPVKKFLWEAGGKRFCAIHGHQFDKFCFMFNMKWMDKLLVGLVWLVKQVDQKKEHIAGLIDKIHNRHSERIAKKARRYALRHNFDTIICGHTHIPEYRNFLFKKRNRTIGYLNCGSWTEETCSLVIVDQYGTATLRRINGDSVLS